MRDAVDAVGLARTLVDYNEWATERVLRAADRVPDDLFSQMLPGAGHGSIFGQSATSRGCSSTTSPASRPMDLLPRRSRRR